MKTFYKFQQDIDEAAALAPALPKLVGLTKMVTPKAAKFGLNALKFGTAVPVGLGIANVLQSKGNGESNFEKLRQQQKKGEGEDLKKKSEEDAKDPTIQQKIKDALVDAGLKYKKGLRAGKEVESTSSTGIIGSASDDFRKKEGGKSPAQIARELFKKQAREYKRKQIKNKKIDRDLKK